MIHITQPQTGLGDHARTILRALPQWFGIEDATQHYIDYANDNPTFYAKDERAERIVGFLSFMQHSPHAAEIYVMGVLPAMHRRGVGRALITAAEDHLAGQGVRFLQVKTLSPKHPDENYAKTRDFYYRCGFVALEEFPELWGKHNPALQLIKVIGD